MPCCLDRSSEVSFLFPPLRRLLEVEINDDVHAIFAFDGNIGRLRHRAIPNDFNLVTRVGKDTGIGPGHHISRDVTQWLVTVAAVAEVGVVAVVAEPQLALSADET